MNWFLKISHWRLKHVKTTFVVFRPFWNIQLLSVLNDVSSICQKSRLGLPGRWIWQARAQEESPFGGLHGCLDGEPSRGEKTDRLKKPTVEHVTCFLRFDISPRYFLGLWLWGGWSYTYWIILNILNSANGSTETSSQTLTCQKSSTCSTTIKSFNLPQILTPGQRGIGKVWKFKKNAGHKGGGFFNVKFVCVDIRNTTYIILNDKKIQKAWPNK